MNSAILKTLIVDDEPLARKELRACLQLERDLAIVGECADGEQAVEAIHRESPDLVFLDIQIPVLDGFRVLETLAPHQMPMVVFVTAFDDHAVKAFDIHACDYVLKPYDRERIAESVAHARTIHRTAGQDELAGRVADLLRSHPQARSMKLPVKVSDKILLLDVERIDWIEAEGDYVSIHIGNEKHLTRATLQSLQDELDPLLFVRIHRSVLVNLQRIKELHPLFRGDYRVVLHDGTKLRLSRTHRRALEHRIGI